MIIPIGIQCTGATFKKRFENTHTLPFDWMFSTPSFVFEMLVLLLEKNMDVEELVKHHFFCCEKRANLKGLEHYYTCDDGFALLNTKYHVIFPHDEHTTETVHKYIRRFERLKDILLNSSECLYFLYSSPSSLESGNYTVDDKLVIKDVYIYVSKIAKLIGTYRTNYKILLFDTIQEEPVSLLDESITLIKLNKCNSWPEVVNQMLEHPLTKSEFPGFMHKK